MNGGFDLSCAKYVKIGTPHAADCPPGKEDDAGLCYVACKHGFHGVGPVCWGSTPSGWVGCGMGAAKDSRTCGEVIFSQVAAVGQIAMTVATLGTSTAATGAATAVKSVTKLAKLKK